MNRQQTIVTAAVFYILGITAGLAIVFYHEPKIFIVGLIGVTFAYFYNAPPLKLSYRGFGELAVAITYGPLICCGTYLVLCHKLPAAVVALSVPLGILIAAFLVINEFPDRKADLGARKMNLVVQLGEKRAGQLYMVMIVTAFVGILFLPQTGLPNTVWLGFIGLPFGAASARRVVATKETVSLIPAQHWMLMSFVLTAVGLGIGLLV
jgi:1,4-dihydroxy-2-naphthoate octaprenyltransferase